MNAEQKPGYKQSEAGLIPVDWKVHQLAELSGSIASGRSKVDAEFGQFPVYGSTGVIGYTNTPSHTGESILVARVGANAGLLNSADGRYGVTDNTIAIRLKPGFDHGYCVLQLKRYGLNRLVFGSGQPLITGTQLKGIPIPTPASEEQVEIVSALSEMADLIRSLNQLIAKNATSSEPSCNNSSPANAACLDLAGSGKRSGWSRYPPSLPKDQLQLHMDLAGLPKAYSSCEVNAYPQTGLICRKQCLYPTQLMPHCVAVR
ncbi:restriction endonuclease subunit S [Pseudomonas lalucatii]|nr:restriction endonuclease subunit S [Pseudomonas lalucatii]